MKPDFFELWDEKDIVNQIGLLLNKICFTLFFMVVFIGIVFAVSDLIINTVFKIMIPTFGTLLGLMGLMVIFIISLLGGRK